ncbi:uncharacterized protein V6R79_014625 [Siganus canaliculatus]
MASGNTEDTLSEPNEHDYAHSVPGDFSSAEASSFPGAPAADGALTPRGGFPDPAEVEQGALEQPSLAAGLPGPAVGAEVDCPGHEVEASPRRTAPPRVVGRRRTSRPEDKNCCCCKTQFERQGRSFNRRAVYTFTTPDTVHWLFPDVTVHDKSFLCETCAQVIRSKSKRKQSGKRSLWLKPPAAKQCDPRDRKKKGRRMGKKSKAALLVSKSCYKAAFKMLWSAKGARKPMMEFWSKQLKVEMKALTRQADNPFHQKVSSKKPLASFPWRRCLSWAQDKAPLVTACLTALFPDVSALSKSSHQLSEEQAQTLLERRAVVALSIPLFTRNIWKNNFLQAALGAELRLQGCSGSALDALNTMGLCQNKDTVRLLLHRLRDGKSGAQNGQQRMKLQQEQMKRDQIGKRQAREKEEEEEEEEDDEEERVEQKKRRVVVVRLDLLKGHSEEALQCILGTAHSTLTFLSLTLDTDSAAPPGGAAMLTSCRARAALRHRGALTPFCPVRERNVHERNVRQGTDQTSSQRRGSKKLTSVSSIKPFLTPRSSLGSRGAAVSYRLFFCQGPEQSQTGGRRSATLDAKTFSVTQQLGGHGVTFIVKGRKWSRRSGRVQASAVDWTGPCG